MNKKQGFTLIELLVVVLIIGILAAVALPQYQKAVMKSRMSSMWALIKAVKDAQEVYFMANGEYVDDLSLLDVDVPRGDVSSSPSAGLEYYSNGTCFDNLSSPNSASGWVIVGGLGSRCSENSATDSCIFKVWLDNSIYPHKIECKGAHPNCAEVCKTFNFN